MAFSKDDVVLSDEVPGDVISCSLSSAGGRFLTPENSILYKSFMDKMSVSIRRPECVKESFQLELVGGSRIVIRWFSRGVLASSRKAEAVPSEL
jgi:hypothetical protein